MSLDSPKGSSTPPTLDDSPTEYAVIGDDHVGTAVAGRLADAGHDVAVVGESADPTQARSVRGDPTDLATLSNADVAGASTVVVATRTDARGLLVAQLVRAHFGAPAVVLTNDPDRLDTVEDAGHDSVCATTAIVDAIVEEL